MCIYENFLMIISIAKKKAERKALSTFSKKYIL